MAMSSRKRPLSEITANIPISQRPNPKTPFATHYSQDVASKRPRSAHSSRHLGIQRPGSARNILRRLAKITAPTTKRRVATPQSIPRGKENTLLQQSDDSEDDLKKPKFTFDLEESIEDEDSELPVAPTPSALLDHSDEDEEPPTITFLEDQNAYRDSGLRSTEGRMPLITHSDTVLQEEQESSEDGEGGSTFLTEKGRRTISEEPTRMSRYSFGSIRMSDFGSELEVRRLSDKQKKPTQTQEEYNYDNDLYEDSNVQLGGETEDLRNVQRSPSATSEQPEETLQVLGMADDTFQFDIPDVSNRTEHEFAAAHQRSLSTHDPLVADSVLAGVDLTESDEDVIEQVVPHSAEQSRRQTLLESVAAVSKPRSRKKLKMNRIGNMVPGLPSALIKRIVNDSQEKAGKRKIALGKDHMKALEQATEWFFEQVIEDLDVFAGHSKRKKRIDTDDVLLLMRRQRVLQNAGDLQDLAKDWLPRELWAELDLPPQR